MPIDIWGTTYTHADIESLVGGGFGSCAVGTVDGVIKLQFKASADGVTWPSDADAINVATLTKAGFFSLEQRTPVGKITLTIYGRDRVNNVLVDRLWTSHNKGRTWVLT